MEGYLLWEKEKLLKIKALRKALGIESKREEKEMEVVNAQLQIGFSLFTEKWNLMKVTLKSL